MGAPLTALSYMGLVLLLGSVLARRWLTPGHPGLWPGFVGAALLFLAWTGQLILTLNTLGMTGVNDVLAYLTGTATGQAMLTGLLGATVLLGVEVIAWPAVFSLLMAGVLLWGAAGIGHGDGHGSWVRFLHTAHAGAMSVWVGGVLALATTRRLSPDLARRFTPAALGSVVTLAASGLLMATEQLTTLTEWVSSPYGRTLVLKVVLVALALLAALLVRRAFARQGRVRPALVREALVLTAVLGVTGVLSNLAPPGGHGQAAGEGAAPHPAVGHDGPGLTLAGVTLCLDPRSVLLTFDGVATGRADRARTVLKPVFERLIQVKLAQSGLPLQRRTSCAAQSGRTLLMVTIRYLDPQHYVGFGSKAYSMTVRLQVLPSNALEASRQGFLADWSVIHSEERAGLPFETPLLIHGHDAVERLIRAWQRDNPQGTFL